MNRKIEKQYIRKVRQSLPVYGCKERAYIKKLEEHLQDYCDEYPDVAEEDIVKEFATVKQLMNGKVVKTTKKISIHCSPTGKSHNGIRLYEIRIL